MQSELALMQIYEGMPRLPDALAVYEEAGFDYARLSHYAHSPAFMDACDELGPGPHPGQRGS